jgi:putative ABC transport system permease protein
MPRFALSPANFYDWQREATAFEGMALYRGRSFTLTGNGAPRSVITAVVGAGFFDVLRVRPAQGRLFRPDEDAPGARVVVISDGFWRTEMGGESVLGRRLTLDGEGYTIIGIMPASASLESWGPMARALWVPLALTAQNRAVRDNHNLAAVARLKPGVRAEEARSQLEVIARRLEHTYPEANAGWGATLVSLQDDIVGNIGSTLVLLLAAVGLVLLIACANVGNLLFTRAPAAAASCSSCWSNRWSSASPVARPACCWRRAHCAPARRCSPARCRAPTRSPSTAPSCCSCSARRS